MLLKAKLPNAAGGGRLMRKVRCAPGRKWLNCGIARQAGENHNPCPGHLFILITARLYFLR